MVLSQHQKFHKCQVVTQQLASLASEVGMAKFHQRFNVLKTLKDTWAEGKEAVVSVESVKTGKYTDIMCMSMVSCLEYSLHALILGQEASTAMQDVQIEEAQCVADDAYS